MENRLQSQIDFKTKSKQIWGKIRSSTPFEQIQKDTGDYTENFYGQGNSEGINFPKLIRFIKDSERDNTLIFNWDDYYIPTTVQQYRVRDGEGGFIDRFKILKNNIPFVYENKKRKRLKLLFLEF